MAAVKRPRPASFTFFGAHADFPGLFFGPAVFFTPSFLGRGVDPPPCAPTNGWPGFPFGFLGAGGRLPKARRGWVFVVKFSFFFLKILFLGGRPLDLPASWRRRGGTAPQGRDGRHKTTHPRRRAFGKRPPQPETQAGSSPGRAVEGRVIMRCSRDWGCHVRGRVWCARCGPRSMRGDMIKQHTAHVRVLAHRRIQ